MAPRRNFGATHEYGNPRHRASKLHRHLPIGDDSPLATRLEKDLALSSGVTRWLYWLEALEKAAPSDFPRLDRLARGNPAVLRLVAERWAEFAPRHLFDTLVAASKGWRACRLKNWRTRCSTPGPSATRTPPLRR